jgi:predicted dienelactone hydrolase
LLPVILWSHGLGGSRDGAGFLARYLASYGYIIVHIQHDGTDTSLWMGKEGHPWDVMRQTKIPEDAIQDRFLDISFALDCLFTPQTRPEKSGLLMNLDLIGMSGHSMGALTTQIIAGQPAWYRKDFFEDLHDSRLKSGIVYSPVPSKHFDHNPRTSYDSFKIPLFFMTGTLDESPLGGFEWTDRVAIYEQSGAPESHLLILNEGNHMVFAGSRGQLEDSPHRETHETIIQHLSLVWWDAFLKDDQTAHLWLKNESTRYLQENGTYHWKKL